ncbi:MAG: CocE/NonD family hydrolase [Humibacillus sp.]|nr:CocE/NonD family hydrolase [Humibacillus sp.]
MALIEEPGLQAAARLSPMQRLRHRQLTQALPQVRTGGVRVERDIPVRMSDGTVLLTDHWAPAERHPDQPVLLTRTPYGRDSFIAEARVFAERGHHVVVQSCRGHFGSGGTFDPFFTEADDGLDCVAWLEAQPWFTGRIHTYGFSYVGLTQWALTRDTPASVEAMVIGISARSFLRSIIHHRGGFGMETAVVWNLLLDGMEGSVLHQARSALRGRRGVQRGSDAIPPTRAVQTATGSDSPFFQDWLAHDGHDPWWQPVDFATVPESVPPLVLVAGWYDLFGHTQVEDFIALRAAGRPVRLVAGPWTHVSQGLGPVAVQESLRQLAGVEEAHDEPPVRIKPIGSSRWLDLDAWPPAGRAHTYHLHPGGALRDDAPSGESKEGYRYDPADPTPMTGGRSLNPWTAGRKRQRERERRSDVLCWTTDPLAVDTLVAGEVVANVVLSSSNPTVDLFLRLCEVDGKGRSWNIADGYVRVVDDGAAERGVMGGPSHHEVRLGATAALVRRGHRLRLQISSGAHPLHLRNSGNADGVHDFSRLVPSEQRVYLGPSGTSVVVPVADHLAGDDTA